MGRMDVVVLVAVVHDLKDRGPDRPMQTRWPPHGQGNAGHREPTSGGPRPNPSNFLMLSRGPVRPITFSKLHGPARSINFQKISKAYHGPFVWAGPM